MADFEQRLLKGYRLTTAEIVYHLPDYPELLQSFIWQNYDKAPQFPVLENFVRFWTREIDGSIHTIYLGSTELITPEDLSWGDFEIRLQ